MHGWLRVWPVRSWFWCHLSSSGIWGSYATLPRVYSVLRSAKTQTAERVANKRGQEKRKHCQRPAGRVLPSCHISVSHTQSLSPFTPPPPCYSAVVDLWSSRRSMSLRGDQAQLHTSSVKRRSTVALKPCRTFSFAIFCVSWEIFFFLPVYNTCIWRL